MNYFGTLFDPIISEDTAIELLQTLHPRFLFIKRLKRNAKLLDFGAGEGGIIHFKEWITPIRNDLKMYAYSLEKGEYFDKYDNYEIGKWPDHKPFDAESFDAIFSSHFIEHIQDQEYFIKWCHLHLNPGGQLYLEFPSEFSVDAPTTSELAEKGIDVYTGNFFDDKTHVELPDWKKLSACASDIGFFIQEQGIIKTPFLENEIPGIPSMKSSKFALQMAYWSKSNWCRYSTFLKQR